MRHLRLSLLSGLPFMLLALLPEAVKAQAAPGIDSMFSNFSASSVSLMNLVVATAFVAGIVVSGVGILKLKEYGSEPGRHKFGPVIWTIFVGVMLIATPGFINVTTETLSLGANTGTALLSRGGSGNGTPAGVAGAMAAVLLFVKLIGTIAFVRGIFMLKAVGQGSQQVSMGAALTHLFGGAAAININATAAILAATFAPGLPVPI
jgi:hypothetical protein